MQKKLILQLFSVLFVSLVLFDGIPALAQAEIAGPEAPPPRPINTQIKKEIQNVRENNQATRTDARIEMKNQLEQKKTEMKTARLQNMAERFDKIIVKRVEAGVERLIGIADRIDSHLKKLAGKGIDVTKPITLLAEARVKIAVVKADIDLLKNSVETTLSASSTPKDLSVTFRTASSKTKEDLKTAHRALVLTVESIKPGQNKASTTPRNATTTNE